MVSQDQDAEQSHREIEAMMLRRGWKAGKIDTDVVEPENTCQALFLENADAVGACMLKWVDEEMYLAKYEKENFNISWEEISLRYEAVAGGEALKRVQAKGCTLADLGIDSQQEDLIRSSAIRSAERMIMARLKYLEDPETEQTAWHALGGANLEELFDEAHAMFKEACNVEQDAKTSLFVIADRCHDHLNLDTFLTLMAGESQTTAHLKQCNTFVGDALLQAQSKRHNAEQHRAKLVQVLHSEENGLADYYRKHLRHGGSAHSMDMLVRHAVLNTNLTDRHVALLQKMDDLVKEDREKICSGQPAPDGIIAQSATFKDYIHCLCNAKDISLVCEAKLIQGWTGIASELKRKSEEYPDLEEEEVLGTGLAESNASLGLGKAGVAPCVLFADSYSCEVCAGHYCKSRRRKAAREWSCPWCEFVDALNKALNPSTTFKASCTKCMAIQPGEQISFETELYAQVDVLQGAFASTEIGVEAKTCIGPGSPMRILFESLGIDACKTGFSAKYKPFTGEFDIFGKMPVALGMFAQSEINIPMHDPPGAVRAYCNAYGDWTYSCSQYSWYYWYGWRAYCTRYAWTRSSDKCYNKWKNSAGSFELTLGAVVPLIWPKSEFWTVKVSGPHSSGKKWKVQVFEMPFNDVIESIKKFWDNEMGPAIEDALNDVGIDVDAAGEWTKGAADSAGKWTVGAAESVASAAKDVGNAISNVFSGKWW
jgi:hypothetical protein